MGAQRSVEAKACVNDDDDSVRAKTIQKAVYLYDREKSCVCSYYPRAVTDRSGIFYFSKIQTQAQKQTLMFARYLYFQ